MALVLVQLSVHAITWQTHTQKKNCDCIRKAAWFIKALNNTCTYHTECLQQIIWQPAAVVCSRVGLCVGAQTATNMTLAQTLRTHLQAEGWWVLEGKRNSRKIKKLDASVFFLKDSESTQTKAVLCKNSQHWVKDFMQWVLMMHTHKYTKTKPKARSTFLEGHSMVTFIQTSYGGEERGSIQLWLLVWNLLLASVFKHYFKLQTHTYGSGSAGRQVLVQRCWLMH